MHLVARAYPTHRTDPAISAVEFTVSWDGRPGPWLVACRLQQPVRADVYECDWDATHETETVPAGRLHVSFDVYDEKGSVNKAPHGIRTISYKP